MTTSQWIGALIASGGFGWWIEHRRWIRPGKRHSVYVRDVRLARDQVFLDGLSALIDKAWECNTGSRPE